MSTPTSKQTNIAICQQGMKRLAKDFHSTQIEVVEKLQLLGHNIGRTTFSNIITGKTAVGAKSLQTASDGIQAVLWKEHGMEWTDGEFVKTAGDGFVAESIPIRKEQAKRDSLKLHETGRLPIQDKIAFFQDAQKEVIEFGVTLNTFSGYLHSRNENEFKVHVASLLAKGIHFSCYLLEPGCNEARLYFNDREPFLKSETHFEQTIQSSITKLSSVQEEFEQKGFPGKFRVFAYRHVPSNYFMAVDGGKPYCRMMVSHYLYGLRRADTPVWEFSRNDHPHLYRRYWDSLTLLRKGAKQIVPPG